MSVDMIENRIFASNSAYRELAKADRKERSLFQSLVITKIQMLIYSVLFQRMLRNSQVVLGIDSIKNDHNGNFAGPYFL